MKDQLGLKYSSTIFRVNNFTEVNKTQKKVKLVTKKSKRTNKIVIIRRESPAFFSEKKSIFKLLKKNMPRALDCVYL